MNDELREITLELVKKTERGEVVWKHGSQDPWVNRDGVFIEEKAKDFAFSTHNFTINIYEGASGASSLHMNIHNGSGDVVIREEPAEDTVDYEILRKLLAAAAEQVWSIRKTLDAIKQALGSERPDPSTATQDDVPF
jgi:hypothetical protein